MSRSPLTRKPDPDYQCAVCLGGKGCRPFPLTITAIRQFTPDVLRGAGDWAHKECIEMAHQQSLTKIEARGRAAGRRT